jgi:hypothetical protein
MKIEKCDMLNLIQVWEKRWNKEERLGGDFNYEILEELHKNYSKHALQQYYNKK